MSAHVRSSKIEPRGNAPPIVLVGFAYSLISPIRSSALLAVRTAGKAFEEESGIHVTRANISFVYYIIKR
jgi:hypothetical protein